MAKLYSEIYSYDYSENMKEQKFRYNYDDHNLEIVCIPNKEMLEEIKDDALNCKLDWMRIEAQENLKSYEETGYVVITAEGLSEQSWKEDKEYYMEMMCENTAYLISEAIEEFTPEVSKKEEGKKMGSANDISLASALNELSRDLDPYKYMDNYNSLEEGLQYFIEALNNPEQTKIILDHLHQSQEETPDIWGPKEREVLQRLEKYSSQQFSDMAIGSKQNENIAMKVVYAKDLKPSYVDSRNNKVYKSIEEISVATGMTQKKAYREVNHPYGIFKKIYQAEGITVPDVVYRKSKVHNIPMVLKNGSMWYIPNKSEIQNIEISEEDITKLVAAGDWHIDENDHERFVVSDNPSVAGNIGYVSFGNYIYDISCVDFNPDNSNFAVDIFERRPVEDIGQTTNILSQEDRLYTFEAIDVDELTEKYLQDGSDNYTMMDRNEYNSRGLDEFKRDIVKALATATAIDSKGFKYHLPFIEPKYAEAYTALKESGQGFPQYYEKQRKVLEHLADFEYNPNKFKWYLPGDTKQLIHSEKLSPEQIDILGGYYDHFRECYHDNKLDYVANKRMLVRKMIKDGLSDSRITAINDSIFDRFERYTTSVSKPQFNQVVSDLIKETRANLSRKNSAERAGKEH